MILAIIGADGAGKTTIAKRLFEILSEKRSKVEFNKSFEEYFLLGFFLSISQKKREEIVKEVFVEGKTPPSSLVRYVWPLLVYIDQFILYLYVRIFKKSHLVITDRYPYSFLVSWEYYGLSNSLLRFLYKRFPKPDLCVVLWADPETLMERKKYQEIGRGNSYNIDFFKKHLDLYDKLAKKNNFLVVNSTFGVDNTVKCVLEALAKKNN